MLGMMCTLVLKCWFESSNCSYNTKMDANFTRLSQNI